MQRGTPHSTRRQAYATCVLAAVTVVACAALMTAAILAPAPPAALPLAVLVCIGCPMAMAWSLPRSLATLRAPDHDKEVKVLRRQLSRLPETQHPLGL